MKNKKVTVISLFLAVFSAVILWAFLTSIKGKYEFKAQRINVLVAKGDINEGEVLRDFMVTAVRIPREFVMPKALSLPEDVTRETYITLVPIMAGEQVVLTKLAQSGREAGLSYVVPTDKRAMTIPVDEATGFADLLKPGNFVDVLATYDMGEKTLTKTLVQNVLVLAYRQKIIGAVSEIKKEAEAEAELAVGPEITRTVTLALTPEEAQRVALALEKGTVNLSLRGVNDMKITEISPIVFDGIKPETKK